MPASVPALLRLALKVIMGEPVNSRKPGLADVAICLNGQRNTSDAYTIVAGCLQRNCSSC
jgi:hypothetical protein